MIGPVSMFDRRVVAAMRLQLQIPTRSQRVILQRLADGGQAEGASLPAEASGASEAVTIHGLTRAGWIAKAPLPGGASHMNPPPRPWTITDAGRAALARV